MSETVNKHKLKDQSYYIKSNQIRKMNSVLNLMLIRITRLIYKKSVKLN